VALTGLRNPWRFSFDPALGEVWIGDVGQDEVEEVNRVLLEPDEPPKNLGWDAFEGAVKTAEDDFALDTQGELVWPVATYTHDDGCSITGGYVYQGTRLPRLTGRYLYGDFCSGVLWSLEGAPKGGAADVRRERAAVPQLTHIGPDADGEPLFASTNGAIYRARRPGRRP
jgi:glucose/arabinose dehydrogenase